MGWGLSFASVQEQEQAMQLMARRASQLVQCTRDTAALACRKCFPHSCAPSTRPQRTCNGLEDQQRA